MRMIALTPLLALVACDGQAASEAGAKTAASGTRAKASAMVASYTYECRSESKGRDGNSLTLVREVAAKSALEEDQWQASFMQSGVTRAKKFEWGISEGGSLALTWTPRDGSKRTAYLSFGDIPEEHGAQPLSVVLEMGGGAKVNFDKCSVSSVQEVG